MPGIGGIVHLPATGTPGKKPDVIIDYPAVGGVLLFGAYMTYAGFRSTARLQNKCELPPTATIGERSP